MVTGLVGAQFGSEGKGLVAYEVAWDYNIHVRTGGPNAGHTFYHLGEKYVARSIPVGWVNPNALVIIGAGAVLDLDVLEEEVKLITDAGWDLTPRLFVDRNATVITHEQHHGEGGVNGNAHQAIGSTGEGVGLARMARINRTALLEDQRLVYESAYDATERLEALGINRPIDTVSMLNDAIDKGSNVLLEGTQGSGLSLVHGPWPYCTSADTNTGQQAVDAGISPSLVTKTILVARTFPIRVAGNSGPLPNETSFDEIGVPPEFTTVTKKQRRIAKWHADTVRKAVTLNRPAEVVVTFMDYLFPEVAEATSWGDLSGEAKDWVAEQEKEIGAPVVGVGTGPHHLAWVE